MTTTSRTQPPAATAQPQNSSPQDQGTRRRQTRRPIDLLRVHFARNLLALIPKTHKDMVAAVFRTIFAQPDPGAVSAAWEQVRDQLTASFPKAGPLMDDSKAEVLAFAS